MIFDLNTNKKTVCIAECSTPSPANYGTYQIISSPSEESFVEGTTIKYACNIGYVTINETTLKCDERQWHPSSPPDCLLGTLLFFNIWK